MTRVAILAALAGCTVTHALRRPHEPTPVAAMLVDAALAGVGACLGMSEQFAPYPNKERMVLGYGVAMAVYLPLWVVETK